MNYVIVVMKKFIYHKNTFCIVMTVIVCYVEIVMFKEGITTTKNYFVLIVEDFQCIKMLDITLKMQNQKFSIWMMIGKTLLGIINN